MEMFGLDYEDSWLIDMILVFNFFSIKFFGYEVKKKMCLR